MMLRLFLWAVLCSLSCEAYKILVYAPTISRSHMLENGRIADSLAADGHNVTLISLNYFHHPESIRHTHKAKLWVYDFHWANRPAELPLLNNFLHYNLLTDLTDQLTVGGSFNDACLAILDDREFIAKLRAEKFDVIIYEQFLICPIVLAELADIDVRIWTSSCPLMEHQAFLAGIPSAMSYVPPPSNSPYSDRMTYTQRLLNVVRTTVMGAGYLWQWAGFHAELKKRFGDSFPSVTELARRYDMLFINTDEFVDYPRPLPPNTIHIGGLGDHHVNTTLPAPYDELMKRGKKGVVYFSFGSIVRTDRLPEPYMENVLNAFADMPDYFFMVKLAKNDVKSRRLAANIDNIHIVDWAPQPALLAHPRMKLFITHGGYNSIMEAAYLGMPLLSIGIFADQPRNAKVVERNGWGLSLDKLSLLDGAQEFEEKLQKLLSDPRFKANALRIGRILRTKPQTGEQRLLSYMRFLEQNDGHLPELHSVAAHMDFVALNNIDVYLTFVLVLLAGAVLAGIVARRLITFAANVWQEAAAAKQKMA